jgi:predicted nucleic acid-binding protein
MEINADLLILDEKPGRIIALQYGLKIIGVLGVLLEAKQKNLIQTVKPLIDELIDRANFRVNAQLYTNILGIAGEQ